ncbi:hypothetical protein ASE95_11040 [Sphingomonas sp. Leaf231]|uniref:hypothetical protein n=1 Tax=Sphingomonas sp. Leaf231 TaxID=1736301 RepID=UPI0006F9F2C0|nr:hypothetical protein [Sphingomonas sp. Leaf231]KQN93101.1 hypothetical protein ASE95_11040 [Sphingomonas sp. Leaf231]
MSATARWQEWAARPGVRVAGLVLRWAFFAGMIGWMILKVRAIGWAQVGRSLPTNPLFYLLFIVTFLVLPASETIVFRTIFARRLPGAFPVLIRKRVYNSALVGYSGELYLFVWLRRTIGLSKRVIAVGLKDNAILSAIASGVVTALLLIGFAAAGNGRRIAAWLDPGPALLIAALVGAVFLAPLLFRLRRQLIAMPAAQAGRVLGVHVARIVAVVLLQATQWAVVLPQEPWSVWLVFLTAQMVISRLPIVPNRDLLFLSAALQMSNTIDGPREAMAGLLLAGGALTQGSNLAFYLITSLWKQPPADVVESVEGVEVPEDDDGDRIAGVP